LNGHLEIPPYIFKQMRRKDKSIVEKEVIDEILVNSEICRIAFFDKEYPYIVPMNYGYKDNCLYLHCAPEGRKINLIKENPKVCFEIEQYHELVKDKVSCKWTTKYRSIIGIGTIEIINDNALKREGLEVIMTHHGKTDNAYSNHAVDKVVILKLSIKNLSAKQSGDYGVL